MTAIRVADGSIFLNSDNNTGQTKSASQNNWLSHRARSHHQQSLFGAFYGPQQPMTSSDVRQRLQGFFFLLQMLRKKTEVNHVKRKIKHI